MKKVRRKQAIENDDTEPKEPRSLTSHPAVVKAPMIYEHIDDPHNAERSDRMLEQAIVELAVGTSKKTTDYAMFNRIYRLGMRSSILHIRAKYPYKSVPRSSVPRSSVGEQEMELHQQALQDMPTAQGDCIECVIPILYGFIINEWLIKCCKVCHGKKPYRNAFLCGSGRCMLKFIMATKPTNIPVVGWVSKLKLVAATITINWINYDSACAQKKSNIVN